jgi:hypothetical protein
MIVKAHMLPAANSTLYFEQAREQLLLLEQNKLLQLPVRLVGLFAETNTTVNAIWTKYQNSAGREEKIVARESRVYRIEAGRRPVDRHKLLKAP